MTGDLCGKSTFVEGITRIYRNDNGVFSDSGIELWNYWQGASLGWADVNNNGFLDLAVQGKRDLEGWGVSSRLYLNQGDGTMAVHFGDTGPGLRLGALLWGDYDNNGYPDLLKTGEGTHGGRETVLYRNDEGDFVDSVINFPGLTFSSAAWGDFNNTGKLDLLLMGSTNADPNFPDNLTRLYQNTGTATNTPPLPPMGDFAVSFANSALTLSWGAGADAETPPPGLSYNLRMGTAPGTNDVFSCMADPVTGQRRVAAAGPHKTTHLPVHGLESGVTYYWAVQSIDSAFAGSAWSEEQTLTFQAISGRILRADGLPAVGIFITATDGGGTTETDADGEYRVMVPHGWSGRVFPGKTGYVFDPVRRNFNNLTTDAADQDFIKLLPEWEPGVVDQDGARHAYLAVGDLNNDGMLDIVISAEFVHTGNNQLRIYRHEGFRRYSHLTRENNSIGSLALGDFNNNGYLDLANARSVGGFYATQLWLNDTTGGFTGLGYSPAPVGLSSAIAWGDFNNNGRLDLAIMGRTSHDVSELFLVRSLGEHPWWEKVFHIGYGFSGGTMAWADFDNDGDLDLAFSGFSGTRNTRVLRNDGADGFVLMDYGFEHLRDGAVAWGDYNNNGRLDLAIAGVSGLGEGVTRIYRNDGDGVFTDIGAVLAGVQRGSIAWGDYNNNGRLDLAVMGSGPAPDYAPVTRIYRNDGDDVFTDTNADIVQVRYGRMAWGDFNNSGRLDLLLVGQDAHGIDHFKIYFNHHEVSPNTPPEPPTGLSEEPQTGTLSVVFSWEEGRDAQTPAAGLSYNLRVGTTPDGNEIASGMAGADGRRRLPALGNAQKRLSLTLHDLPPGMIYWSVQSIDSAYAGSAWSEERSFELIDTRPPVTVASIKQLPDDAEVDIESVLVTAAFDHVFYIQDDDRAAGIRVQRTSHGINVEQRVDIAGALRTTTDGERELVAVRVTMVEGSGTAVPLALSNLQLGGEDWHHDPVTGAGQQGVAVGTGTNTIGLLVRIWGEVTAVAAGQLYVDDGSGLEDGTTTDGQPNIGVRVLGDTAGHMTSDFLEVTGISACFQSESGTQRRVLALDAGSLHYLPDPTSPMGVALSWYLSFGIAPRSGRDWKHDWSDVDGYDTDADGMLDWQEFVADTDPTDSACVFRATGVDLGPPPTVSFQGSAARVYTLLGRSNLVEGAWQPVPGAGPRPGAGGDDAFVDDNEPSKGPFYRLKVELP